MIITKTGMIIFCGVIGFLASVANAADVAGQWCAEFVIRFVNDEPVTCHAHVQLFRLPVFMPATS